MYPYSPLYSSTPAQGNAALVNVAILACVLQVQFEVCDATKCKYAPGTFEVIYSRDTILHIDDKRDLFAKFLVSLFASYSGCLLFHL